jgi:predicted transcriptional regulator
MLSRMKNLLAEYLADNEQTYVAFAKILGVTDSAVWRWANGQRKPGLNEAYAIERATGGAVPAIYWLAKKSSRAA